MIGRSLTQLALCLVKPSALVHSLVLCYDDVLHEVSTRRFFPRGVLGQSWKRFWGVKGKIWETGKKKKPASWPF